MEEIKNHTFIVESYLFCKPPDPTLTRLCNEDKNCYIYDCLVLHCFFANIEEVKIT